MTNTSIIPINQTSISAETPNINTLPFGFKLNETNFKMWSRMLELHAAGLNKLGYLTGQNARVEKEILVTQSGALKTQWCEDGC